MKKPMDSRSTESIPLSSASTKQSSDELFTTNKETLLLKGAVLKAQSQPNLAPVLGNVTAGAMRSMAASAEIKTQHANSKRVAAESPAEPGSQNKKFFECVFCHALFDHTDVFFAHVQYHKL